MSISYESGGTVAQTTRAQEDPKFAFRIVRDIAEALDYAHRQGVVHRDVKPENILLRPDGNCVLSDFGIAHAVEAQTGLTREGTSVGTPHYMSPEQLRGEHADGRSDLYSLGVVFYQLLTGDLPYQGTDGWAIGMQHIMAPIPKLPPRLSYLQELLDGLLAKEPAARLQSGAEVVRWIDARVSLQTPAMTLAMPTPRGLTSAEKAAQVSIAVLPFVDLSQGKDQEYFVDGLTDEILNLLARVPRLHVASRTATATFRGRNASLAEMGRELKVASMLEGSVRKAGERVRVSVQLINVADGYNLWSETYNRELTDVFAVQEEIAQAVIEALLNNETFFYREPAAFDLLDAAMIRLREARAETRRLRIWCAGCSTGQEAYSLAMHFAADDRWAGWTIDITGSDVSAAAIAQARAGLYSQFEIQRGLPVRQMLRWFDSEGEQWRANAELRQKVLFRTHNLLDAPLLPGRCDVILCRNVLLYFTQSRRAAVFERLAKASAPDGVLMLGAGETVIGQTDRFISDSEHRGLYRPHP
jgi:chemotaxis methyl-accepting protein methylase